MSKTMLEQACNTLIDIAKKKGAVDVDALGVHDIGESIRVRHQQVESVEREDSQGIGLRVFVSQGGHISFASASSSDLTDAGLEKLADQAIAMAAIAQPDPDMVPPSGANHPDTHTLANIKDETPDWTLEKARNASMECESAALAESGISNSEGAEADLGTTCVAYASADGFSSSYQKASTGISVSVLAKDAQGMERDYAFSQARHADHLATPESIGKEAAERTLKRLGASSMPSGNMTVVFEPRASISLLGHVSGAINGMSIVQERSFLDGKLGEQIFPTHVTIQDDPFNMDGLGDRFFDGEGTITQKRNLIENGILTTYMTNRYAAKRLNMEETGHARRGLTGDISIGASNLIWSAGDMDVESLLKDVGNGLLVTEMMGFGVNSTTGDYSRGASGFLIENGEISRPVSEITIAGNLASMFLNADQFANDLTWFGSRCAPTIAIRDMVVAGQG